MKRDMTSMIGIIAGLIILALSIASSGEFVNFIDLPSLGITLVGSFCALLVVYPKKALADIPKSLKVLVKAPENNRPKILTLLIHLAEKARMDGMLALEDEIANMDDELVVTGIQMVVDGMEPEEIEAVLDLQLQSEEKTQRQGQKIFESWGEFAPAFGMLGTLIGLIVMLSSLEDPSSIGGGMATALVTTFYGSLFANLIFLPIAAKISGIIDEQIYTGDMIIEAILEIQAGVNPRLIKDKLVNYLTEEERLEFENLEKDTSFSKKDEVYE